MKFLVLLFVLTLSFNSEAQNILVHNDLLFASFARLGKNDSIFQNNVKTYNYKEDEPFSRLLLEGILSDKFKKFDALSGREWGMHSPLKDTLSVMDIKQNLGYGLSKRIVFDDNNKELYTEILESIIDTASIRILLGFEEKWVFDTTKLRFDKVVLNMLLHREFIDQEDQKMKIQSVAAIPCMANYGAGLKKMARISYEHSMLLPVDWIENEIDSDFVKKKRNAGLLNYSLLYENKNFDIQIRTRFLQSLCNSALNGKLSAVDYFTRKPINSDEVLKRLGGSYDKMLDMKIPPETDDFDAIIFTEDWFMDPQMFSFKKNVKEIALVKYSYAAEDKDLLHPQRYIPFSIILNE